MRVSAILAVLLAAAALVAAASATSVPFKSCDTKSHLQVKTVDANPFPPKKGANVDLSVTGALDKAATGGDYTVQISLFGITIAQLKGDLCDIGACPLKQGTVTLKKSFPLPSAAPSGTYTITVSGNDQDKSSFICVSLDVAIKSGAEDIVVYDEDSLAAAFGAVKSTVPFTPCAGGAGALTVTGVDATPFPIVKGQDASVTVTGTLAAAVTGGTYALTISIFGVPIKTFSGDLCELHACPIPAGAVKLSKALPIPSIAPGGHYTVNVKATDLAGNNVACLDVAIDIQEEEEEDMVVAEEVAAVGQNIPFAPCGAGTLTVSGVDATPFPIVKGQDASVTVTGTLASTITSGTYVVTVTIFGIPIQSLTGDICELTQCPIPAGVVKLSKGLPIPSVAPAGQYTVDVKATDQDGKLVTCVDVVIQIAEEEEEEEDAVVTAVHSNVPGFANCGDYVFSATGVDASPFPPVKGKDCNVVVTGNLKAQVAQGQYTITTTIMGIPINSQTGDLCNLVKGGCPIAAGPVKLSHSLPVPAFAPSGQYQVQVTAFGNGGQLACVTVPITLSEEEDMVEAVATF